MKTINETLEQYKAPIIKTIVVDLKGSYMLVASQENSGEDIDPQGDWSGNGGWNLQ